MILQFVIPPIVLMVALTSVGVSIFGIITLTTALQYYIVVRILLCIIAFVPLVGLIMLLLLNSRPNKLLSENGYKVGFLCATKI